MPPARVGIDLSGDGIALANVSESRGRIQLRGFALLEAQGDTDAVSAGLREARRKYGFPRNAEVVAWTADPRVDAVRQAGYKIERVISPGEALARVAHLHKPSIASGAVIAVIALHRSCGALAVTLDGAVLHETPMTWSVSAGASSHNELLGRYSFLSELSELLRGSFNVVAKKHGAIVSEILTCGSLRDLRSFTMPLAEEFDVEVETLDAIDDVDVRMRKVSPEQLREWIAALRIAIAAGRRSHHARLHRAKRLAWIAVPAGLAAAALYFVAIAGSRAPQDQPAPRAPSAERRSVPSAPAPVARPPASVQARREPSATQVKTATPRVESQVSRTATPAPRVEPPAPRVQAPAARVEPPAPRVQAPAARVEPPAPRVQAPAARVESPPPRVVSPALRTEQASAASAPARTTAAPARAAPSTPSVREVPRQTSVPAASPVTPPPQAAARLPRETAPTPARETAAAPAREMSTPITARPAPSAAPPPAAPRRPEQILPASFGVTSILWSPGRQLAFVDGRIVAVGDTINGARIVRIDQDGVLVRDRAGRLRRASLQPSGQMP